MNETRNSMPRHDSVGEPTPPTMSAVLPLFNKIPFLSRCIESVLRAAKLHGSVEIIVADNGSTDGSFEALDQWRSVVRVLRVGSETISAVRNAGARAAHGSVLVFIDADCVISPEYFLSVDRVIRQRGKDATGFEVRLPSDGTWIESVWDGLHARGDDGPRHYLNSASFALTREAFDSVHGFDERLMTGEDTDICLRLRQAGFTIWADRLLQAVHLDNPRTLGQFYRKERWRGLGGFTRTIVSQRIRSLVVVMLFALTLGASLVALFLPMSLGARVTVSSFLLITTPAIAVAYRAMQTRHLRSPIRAVVLYFVYYFARADALARAVAKRL